MVKVSLNRSLLITRPFRDGIAFSKLIHSENPHIKTVCNPLFEIETFEVKIELYKVNAFIVTSSNAIRSLVNSGVNFPGPVFCVGRATALLAERAGYHSISSGGTGEDLLKLIKSSGCEGKKLIYFRGEKISRDLVAPLRKNNCYVDEVICYKKSLVSLSSKILNGIANGSILGASFFSKQTAELFFNDEKKIPQGFIAFCISSDVSRMILSLTPKNSISVRVAHAPTVDEMCKLVVAAPEFAVKTKN